MTIGWGLVHLTDVTARYHEHVFGSARRGRTERGNHHVNSHNNPPDNPHVGPGAGSHDGAGHVSGTASHAVSWWAETSAAFAAALDSTPDAVLDEIVSPPWMKPASVVHMVHTVIEEQVRHGAESAACAICTARTGAEAGARVGPQNRKTSAVREFMVQPLE